ncbi:MAG: hypothetical protein AAGI09_15335 [Pseudomonadota bacterium]
MTSLTANHPIAIPAAQRNLPGKPATWTEGFRAEMIMRHLLGTWLLHRLGIYGI